MNKFILTVVITMAVFTASNACTPEAQMNMSKCIASELGEWPSVKCSINWTPSSCKALDGCKYSPDDGGTCTADGSASTYNQAKACKDLSGLRACVNKLGCWPSFTTTRNVGGVAGPHVMDVKKMYCTDKLVSSESPAKGCPASTCDGAAANIQTTAATTITSSPIAFAAALVVAVAMAR